MPIANAQRSIFEEGRNCRRVADAGRVAFIVDGDDYFKMFMEAAERAQESIIVLAWDFNNSCCLSVECDSKDPRAQARGTIRLELSELMACDERAFCASRMVGGGNHITTISTGEF